MRSADDNLVPSDKDLEHLLRKAQKSAAKKEAYKKTTKQYYRSVANGIVREVFEDSSIDDHYLLLKCLMLRCVQEFSDLHREVGLERMNKQQFDTAAHWISDQGKIAAAAELLAGVEMGEDDWMVP